MIAYTLALLERSHKIWYSLGGITCFLKHRQKANMPEHIESETQPHLSGLLFTVESARVTYMTLERITSNPNRMNGQPCIRDLRLTVRRVLELLATYPDRQELFQEFPELEEEDIQQALVFASSYLDDRIVELSRSDETAA